MDILTSSQTQQTNEYTTANRWCRSEARPS